MGYEILVPLVAIVMGSLMFLIPIAGITARFALKPVIESLAKYRESQGDRDALVLMERRMALLEEQFNGMDRSLRELVEEAEFRRQLEGGARQTIAPPSEGPEL
jgi:hypothetical protein